MEELILKTEPYCFESEEQEDFTTGIVIPSGWWCSDQAVKDIEAMESSDQAYLWTYERMQKQTALLYGLARANGKTYLATTPIGFLYLGCYVEYLN